MYINPGLLPQVSNREDFITTVSIFDDDTGQPIKLDGCTTALGMPFTGSAWTVTDGATVTTSSTVLTIPVFPIYSASQAALFLTVGTNLAISPGDPIQIKDATGLNTMSGTVVSYTTSTGGLVVQIGLTFLFEIRRCGPRYNGTGYDTWCDFGVPGEDGPLLSATLGNGIAIIDIGVLKVVFPVATFQKLWGGTYSTGLIMSDGVGTRQIEVGTVPVIYGGVAKSPLAAVIGPLWN